MRLARDIYLTDHIGHFGANGVAVCRGGAHRFCVAAPFVMADDELVSHRQLDADSVEIAMRGAVGRELRRVTVKISELEAQLLEEEAYRQLAKERFAAALAAAERGLALRPGDEQLGLERAAALYGLGRADEARAAWSPLARRAPVRAYAAAAAFPVLRPSLDFDELVGQSVTPAGTARLHADGTFAGGAWLAVAADGAAAALEADECQSREQVWLRVGDVRVPLGWSDEERFHETGVTAANRLLHDRGFRFDPGAEEAIPCGEDIARYPRHKLWRAGARLVRAPPRGVDPQCGVEPGHEAERDRQEREIYVPALGKSFVQHKSLRACGDGGADPVSWTERVLVGP
jgi:hypothetical protein